MLKGNDSSYQCWSFVLFSVPQWRLSVWSPSDYSTDHKQLEFNINSRVLANVAVLVGVLSALTGAWTLPASAPMRRWCTRSARAQALWLDLRKWGQKLSKSRFVIFMSKTFLLTISAGTRTLPRRRKPVLTDHSISWRVWRQFAKGSNWIPSA